MKVLTSAEMREVDQHTIELGIPGLILMENAGSRVVDFLREEFAPLSQQRVVVICGKGNNGGDGFAIARQLFTRRLAGDLTVIDGFGLLTLSGDALANRQMLEACGCPVYRELPESAKTATIVIDAVLGTGLAGPAKGRALELIQQINRYFPLAKKVAVDIPSGLPSDSTEISGEFVRADYTVTFTAPKRSHVLSPSYELMGKLLIVPIGTPDSLCATNPSFALQRTEIGDFAKLLAPRAQNSNKGMYGHVLVLGGSQGKMGAPGMSGMAALRAGAGLVTVASVDSVIKDVETFSLMTEPLPSTSEGSVSEQAVARVMELMKTRTVLAIGPGLGTHSETVACVKQLYRSVESPAVVDADGLNALAGKDLQTDKIRILTPHPGEMGRLVGASAKEVQGNRLEIAERFAKENGVTLILKGDRSIIAFPDGETFVNPTGSPALATAGTGDILTGLIAGLLAQFPDDWKRAVLAGVYLHGLAGELGAAELGEPSLIATDLLRFLPRAFHECRSQL